MTSSLPVTGLEQTNKDAITIDTFPGSTIPMHDTEEDTEYLDTATSEDEEEDERVEDRRGILPLLHSKSETALDREGRGKWAYDDISTAEDSPLTSRSPSPTSPDGGSSSSSREDESSATSTNSSSSRSSNSVDADGRSRAKDDLVVAKRRSSISRSPLRRSFTMNSVDTEPEKQDGASTPEKKARRPLSMVFSRISSQPEVPTLARLRSSSSMTLSNLGGNAKKTKDELWHAFRQLESDFSKFSDRPNPHKVAITRAHLIPFLRKFDQKASPSSIGMEELDRRVRVLHRWWSGLLAILRNNEPQIMAAADKPIILEAIAGLMVRPEWISPPSSLAPYSLRSPMPSDSVSSFSSASSLYSLQKSVQHNMRTLYTNILTDTLAYLVDRLSFRQPPSFVHFAGKVVAYNFFFCPEAGEMLVGLWALHATQIFRVMSEYGIGRNTDLRAVAEDVINEFPVCIQHLGLTTLSSALKFVRRSPKRPIGTTVNWYGPWVPRWRGYDTDLLFVFIKHYHMLLAKYLPLDASPAARLCAPGFVYVQAQLLTVIDKTIHRRLSPAQMAEYSPGPSSVTFDDVLEGAPPPSPNPRHAPRNGPENKVFVMVRDVSADQKYCSLRMKQIFAETIAALLKAGTKKVQAMDHAACVVLCDVLEEGLVLLRKFEKMEQTSKTNFVDWPFLLEVLKKMIENQNNMSELRVFSFLYTLWDQIMEDQERLRLIVLDWMLSEDIWNRFFCHWCPMVRSYYMRLLCWRVAHFSGNNETSQVQADVYRLLESRLKESFANYLWIKDQADQGKHPRVLVGPCAPAPNRRMTIVQCEPSMLSSGKIFSFEGIPVTNVVGVLPGETSLNIPPPAPIPPQRSATAPPIQDTIPTEKPAESVGSSFKRRWTSFKNLLSSSNDGSESNPEKQTNYNNGSNTPPRKSQPAPEVYVPPPLPRRPSFRFSLEQVEKAPPITRHRQLNPPRLPPQTQEFLNTYRPPVDQITMPELPADFRAPPDWKILGKSLSEWSLIVDEAENYFERRKSENGRFSGPIEPPMLTIEYLKK